MVAESANASFLRRGIHPWPRRLHFALNYLPVIIVVTFLWLFVLIEIGWTNLVFAGVSTVALILMLIDWLGRRPHVRRVDSYIEIRNIVRSYRIPKDSIQGTKLHTFLLGKDTCPALQTTTRRKAIPVLACFGFDANDVIGEFRFKGK